MARHAGGRIGRVTGTSKDLARLKAVDPREVWENETADFTPWLAEPENLRLVGETLGTELDGAKTEQAVGSFSADIVATNAANNRTVVIENQLEKTDHDHLGKILTYAAGLDALTVVWIAKQFTEEHRAALEWLNNHTSADIGFFGLEIEVWKIDDSRCAPKLNIVAKPNEWVKTLPSKTKRTATQQAQFDFWSGFKDYATEHATRISPTAPQPQTWMGMGIGRDGFALNAIAAAWGSNTGKSEVRAEFVINGKDAKQRFDQLNEKRSEIDASFDSTPEWYSEAGVQQRKIYFRKVVDWQDPDKQEGCYEWLVKNLDRLHEVFQPRINQLP